MLSVIDIINYLKSEIPYKYYANEFPASAVDDVSYVRLTGGGAPDHVISVKRPSFQVMVRASLPANAESKANSIYANLHQKRDFILGNTRVILCSANQSSPVYIGSDANGRAVYSINFTVLVAE
jgi:hypothetical protein